MKLTDEQIAAFEARAEAGEKPVLEWKDGSLQYQENMGEVSVAELPWPIVEVEVMPDLQGCSQVKLFPSPSHIFEMSHDAAILAAEHLLREATRGLHAEAYRAIEELREWAVETLQAPRTGSNSHENAWLDGARHKAEGVLHRLPQKEKTYD